MRQVQEKALVALFHEYTPRPQRWLEAYSPALQAGTAAVAAPRADRVT
jgi:hypothetical protein